MSAVEPKLCIGGTGISRSPLKLCRAQSIPEKPVWTESSLALTPLPSPSVPLVEMAPKLSLIQLPQEA